MFLCFFKIHPACLFLAVFPLLETIPFIPLPRNKNCCFSALREAVVAKQNENVHVKANYCLYVTFLQQFSKKH